MNEGRYSLHAVLHEKSEERDRFSAMQYIAHIRNHHRFDMSRDQEEAADSLQRMNIDRFRELIEEMKSFLITAKGTSEEDKLAYSETLNRAILGYSAERGRLLAMIHDELAKQQLHHILPPVKQYDSLAEALFAEIIGLHVLEVVMKDRDGLEEIQVVGTQIFELRHGNTQESPYRFRDTKEVERIQQNLVLFNNEVFNPRKPWAEVMLIDGSRVTMTGFGFSSEPTLTIRFFPLKDYQLHTLTLPRYATLNDDMLRLLQALVRSYLNLVVIGPTNSGKTHLMKALIAEMPDHERIITIESRLELMLKRDFPNKNVIEYETDASEAARSNEQAFKLALRQSPRRICHAEIRDEDANIYVRACTRGHDGSMTSVHVSELEDVPDAITDMCMLDRRGMNPERLRKRIVEFVTHIGLEMALVDGKRKLVRMAEFSYEEDRVKLSNLVRYDPIDDVWRNEGSLSEKAALRIRRFDPEGYDFLKARGWIG